MINAKNKLAEDLIIKFNNTIESKVILDINGNITELTKDTYIYKLFNKENDKLDDNSVIILKSENDELEMTGSDYNWWNANTRRINKMIRAIVSEPVILTELTYSVGIATLIEGKLSDIQYFEGNKKDVIESLNQNIVKRYIDNFLKAKIVINLCYDKNDINNTNLDYWFTLDELQDMGAISLK